MRDMGGGQRVAMDGWLEEERIMTFVVTQCFKGRHKIRSLGWKSFCFGGLYSISCRKWVGVGWTVEWQ